MAKAGVNFGPNARPILNQQLAAWLKASPRHRLSYLVNNNPQGVLNFLQAKGASIRDLNQDGVISTGELYAALTTYAQQQYGSIDNFIAATNGWIVHNDNAPRKWNVYKS